MKRWISEKVPEAVRRELSAAVPAAMRAATHAGKEFVKKFTEVFRSIPTNTPLTLTVTAKPRAERVANIAQPYGTQRGLSPSCWSGAPKSSGKFLSLGAWQN